MIDTVQSGDNEGSRAFHTRLIYERASACDGKRDHET